MKKILPSLVAAFLWAAIVPLHATLIVYGTISGEVTFTTGGPFVRTTVGMPVSGYFSYDYGLLSAPDSSGDRTLAPFDLNSSFVVFSSVREGGSYGDDLLQLTVDSNGLPRYGNGEGQWDISIGPSYVALTRDPGDGWQANVTYTITGVPDTTETWFLLGIGLASTSIARHFFRQIRV
jgi:hypothetical protein